MWRDDDIGNNQSYKFTVTPDYFRMNAQTTAGGMHFGREEIRQIVLSVAILTLAFAIVLSGGLYLVAQYPMDFVFMLGAAFLAVFTGFLLHELSHKKLAQSYGCFAEYRMSLWGVFMALITSLIGFLFALPGAVVISGRITIEQSGKISLAGPAMNMIIGAVCFLLIFAIPMPDILFLVFYVIAFVNIWLAVFNLIPIFPLDGSKVLQWSIPIYIASMAAAVVLFGSFYFYA